MLPCITKLFVLLVLVVSPPENYSTWKQSFSERTYDIPQMF